MNEFQQYRKSAIAEMRPYVPGEDLAGITINQVDAPSLGGMIVRDPKNPKDQWYISAEFFKNNYEEAGENINNNQRVHFIREAVDIWNNSSSPELQVKFVCGITDDELGNKQFEVAFYASDGKRLGSFSKTQALELKEIHWRKECITRVFTNFCLGAIEIMFDKKYITKKSMDQNPFSLEQEVVDIKQLRKDTDEIIQRAKKLQPCREVSLVITKLQEGVMWLGMDLKRLNEPNPYPSSKDPSTGSKIEPTADGLKL